MFMGFTFAVEVDEWPACNRACAAPDLDRIHLQMTQPLNAAASTLVSDNIRST
jgi:hypothetical protein